MKFVIYTISRQILQGKNLPEPKEVLHLFFFLSKDLSQRTAVPVGCFHFTTDKAAQAVNRGESSQQKVKDVRD